MELVVYRNAAEVLARHAAQKGTAPAICCEDRTVSYRVLEDESNRLARAIVAAGATRGTRVAFLGKESELYYELFFACAKSESVLVPVNWRLAAQEVLHILRDSGAALLFVEHDFLGTAERIRGEGVALHALVDIDGPKGRGTGLHDWKDGQSAEPLRPKAERDHPIVQLYTSGTTGLPKGVVLAHRTFFAIREGLLEHGLDWLDWRADDVSLIGIPGFHIAGIWWAMQGFTAGVKNVCLRTFQSHEVVQVIASHGVTTSLVVPAMMYMLLAEAGHARAPFVSLRKLAYGGSPISEKLLRESMAVFGCELLQLYGLTESGNAAVCLPSADHVPGSPLLRAAGRVLPGVEIQVVDEQGRRLPAGSTGEVCLRTPAAMLEYWRLPGATRETLREGWLHTGDAGYLDPQGYLFICDRIKDMIIVAGENVYPAEVENALCEHPAIKEAAVVGIPDERWGESVHAYVVVRSGQAVSPRALMLFLKQRIADFKVPTGYHFTDAIPRNPSGKILRRVLREASKRGAGAAGS